MVQHELVLLSPYRFPGQSSLVLGNEDMASWLNGYTALWHPALVWNAKGPPRCEAQYDHEQPRAATVYALPENPPLYLPDDWDDRVRAAGSIAFRAGVDRAATMENLRAALYAAGQDAPGWPPGLSICGDKVAPFFGIGLGHLLQATLAEAMEHENLLDAAAFWDDVEHAVAHLAGFSYAPAAPPAYNPEIAAETRDDNREMFPEEVASHGEEPTPNPSLSDKSDCEQDSDTDGWRTHLRNAAQKLLSAREVLYPVTIHLLDLMVVDERDLGQPWPAGS